MSKDVSSSAREIEDVFGRHIQMAAVPEEELLVVPVSASSYMRDMAIELFTVANQLALQTLTIKEEEVVEAFEWLLTARCWYVSGGRSEIHPRDVEYPALMGPILAAVGRFRDDRRNITILPCPNSPELVDVDEETGLATRLKKQVRLQQPECFRKVVSALRTAGVPTVFGLPMDKDVEDDFIYRMSIVDMVLKGDRTEVPSPTIVFTRALVNVVSLAHIYGSHRVRYATLGAVRAGIHDFVQRNVDGPRTATRT